MKATDFLDEPVEKSAEDFLNEGVQTSSLRRVADVGISALKGAIGVPEAAVGLADLVTGGHAGKLAEDAGFRPKEAKAFLDEYLSPQQQAANKALADTQGFLATIGTAVKNPSTILHSAVESLPLMGAGGVAARGLMKAAGAAPWAAGAIGEGAAGMGSAAETIRQESPDRLLDAKQTLSAVGSGLGTAAFGAAGGKLAQKLKIADIDTMIAQGSLQAPAGASAKGFARRLAEGAVSEGVFEELPQSLQEQMWQNYALDKPIMQGVPEAGAMGMLTGAVMGGPAAALGGSAQPAAVPPAPPAPPPPQLTPREKLLHDTAEAVKRRDMAEAKLSEITPAAPTQETQNDESLKHAAANEKADEANAQENADEADETLQVNPNPGTITPNVGPTVREPRAIVPDLSTPPLAGGDADPSSNTPTPAAEPPISAQQDTIAPKQVGGIPVSAQSDEQAITSAPAPESQVTTGKTPDIQTFFGKPITEVKPGALRMFARSGGKNGKAAQAELDRREALKATISKPDAISSNNEEITPPIIAAAPIAPNPGTIAPNNVSQTSQNEAIRTGNDTEQPVLKAAVPAVKEQLFAQWGGQTHPVDSLEDASRKWQAFQEKTGAGVSEVGNGINIVDQTGKAVARVSYNGRVWPPGENAPGTKPLYIPAGEAVQPKTLPAPISANAENLKQPTVKETEAPAVAKPRQVEKTTEVLQQEAERFQGQYSDGMGKPNAAMKQREFAAKRPELTWTVEPSTKREDRFDVVGRKPDTNPAIVSGLPVVEQNAKKADKAARKVEESVQEKSEREASENYGRVVAENDLTKISTKDLFRAEGWGSRVVQNEKRKGWDGGAVKTDLVRSMEVDLHTMNQELRRRGAIGKPDIAPTAAQPAAPAQSTAVGEKEAQAQASQARKRLSDAMEASKGISLSTPPEQVDKAVSDITGALEAMPKLAPASQAQPAPPVKESLTVAPAKSAKPRMAETAGELFAAVKKAGGGILHEGRILYPTVRLVAGGGDFRVGMDGKIEAISSDGRSARDATKSQADDVHDAIEKDQAMVVLRSGWGGSGNAKSTASKDLQVLHSPSGNSWAQPVAEKASIDAEKATESPAAEKQPEAKPAKKPALTASEIPADVTITLQVKVEDSGEVHDVEFNAREAFRDSGRQVKRLQALLDCVRSA